MIDKVLRDQNYDILQLINNYIEMYIMLEETMPIDKLESKIKRYKKIEIADDEIYYAFDEIIKEEEKKVARAKKRKVSLHMLMGLTMNRWYEYLNDLTKEEMEDLGSALEELIKENEGVIKECSIFNEWSKEKAHISIGKENYKDENYYNRIHDVCSKEAIKSKKKIKLYEDFIQRIDEFLKGMQEKKFTE